MSDTTATIAPVVNDDTVTAYRAADTKGKAAIRKSVTAAMMSAMDGLDLATALDHKATLAALTTSPAAKPATDYALEIAQRIVDLRRAADYLAAGVALPSGITADMVATSPTDLDTVDWDALQPSSDAHVIASAKITRSADRNSIQGVVDRAFNGLPEGTFLTCQEIANRGGLDGYRPSSGAVAARLQPRNDGDCTLLDVVPDHNEKGVLGARTTVANNDDEEDAADEA